MKNRIFWVVLAVVVAGLIGIFALANSQNEGDGNEPATASQAVTAEDHVLGNPEATTTLVEYADYQCPACASYAPIVQRLGNEYQADLKIVYRHFPLSSIHPNAFPAARAAEAAAAQGKFFEMSELLYNRQDDWSADSNALNKFRTYAQELGLNIDKFNTDYNSQTVTNRINRDITMANDLDVSSTPTFYLNNQRLQNPGDYEVFSQLIKESITP